MYLYFLTAPTRITVIVCVAQAAVGSRSMACPADLTPVLIIVVRQRYTVSTDSCTVQAQKPLLPLRHASTADEGSATRGMTCTSDTSTLVPEIQRVIRVHARGTVSRCTVAKAKQVPSYFCTRARCPVLKRLAGLSCLQAGQQSVHLVPKQVRTRTKRIRTRRATRPKRAPKLPGCVTWLVVNAYVVCVSAYCIAWRDVQKCTHSRPNIDTCADQGRLFLTAAVHA